MLPEWYPETRGQRWRKSKVKIAKMATAGDGTGIGDKLKTEAQMRHVPVRNSAQGQAAIRVDRTIKPWDQIPKHELVKRMSDLKTFAC